MNLSKIMQIQKLMKENRGSVYKTEQSVNTLKHLHFFVNIHVPSSAWWIKYINLILWYARFKYYSIDMEKMVHWIVHL